MSFIFNQVIKLWDKMCESDKKRIPQPKNIYIVKPGEVTNRGNGISIQSDIIDIENIINVQEFHKNGNPLTYIIQVYIDRPLLYNKRKFDIRCFMLLTSQNGILKGYWFEEGYIRTSSAFFNLKNIQNKMIHLTNDAIQKRSEDYGKFEGANKISYKEFDRYLQQNHSNINFKTDINSKMKKTAAMSIKSVYGSIDPNKLDNSFEIFGLDYMLDEDFKVYLIEVNTNPCFEQSSTLLSRLIPQMIDNALRIAIDPVFPPPDFSKWIVGRKENLPENIIEQNKFELIFDELIEGKQISDQKLNSQYREQQQKIEPQIYQIEEESDQEQSNQHETD